MVDRYINSKAVWELVWISGARPPVHPEPMRGRQTFKSLDAALTFFVKLAPDAVFESLTLVIEERKDFSEDARSRIARMKEVASP